MTTHHPPRTSVSKMLRALLHTSIAMPRLVWTLRRVVFNPTQSTPDSCSQADGGSVVSKPVHGGARYAVQLAVRARDELTRVNRR
jgi:hypothetical protein